VRQASSVARPAPAVSRHTARSCSRLPDTARSNVGEVTADFSSRPLWFTRHAHSGRTSSTVSLLRSTPSRSTSSEEPEPRRTTSMPRVAVGPRTGHKPQKFAGGLRGGGRESGVQPPPAEIKTVRPNGRGVTQDRSWTSLGRGARAVVPFANGRGGRTRAIPPRRARVPRTARSGRRVGARSPARRSPCARATPLAGG
jgi:hypothetical protein